MEFRFLQYFLAIVSPAVQTFMDILLRNVEPAPEA